MLLMPNATVLITRPSASNAIIYASRRVNIDDPEDVMELMTPQGQQMDRIMEDRADSLWQNEDKVTILSQGLGGTVSSRAVFTISSEKVVGGLGLESKIARLRTFR